MSSSDSKLMPPIDCSVKETVEQAYRRFGKAALSKLCHVVKREDIARELLQDVFIKLWQSAPIFAHESMLYGWIYRSCHNSGVDYLRSAVFRRESVAFSPEEDQRTNSGDSLKELLAKERVRRILCQLSERDARIVSYVAIDEMTHEETAKLLGVAKKTVTRTILRTRTLLAKQEATDG